MKIAFIGCGNMGGAILEGILNAKLVKKEDIYVCVSSSASKERINKEKGVCTTLDGKEAVEKADVLIIAIKPYKFEEVLPTFAHLCKDKLIISVAAGVTIQRIMEIMGHDSLAVVRTMPNTPACVQEALTSISYNAYVKDKDKELVESIFTSFGKVIKVDEEQIHTVIAMSGSSPAYVFMLLSAMVEFG